jgi:hypothetical protein
MSAHEQSNAPGRGDGVWIFALAVLFLGILGYGYFLSSNKVSDPAILAGQYLFYALIVWGIFYAIFLRKRGPKKNAVAFFSIYASLFFGGLIASSHQEQEAVKLLYSIQQDLARVTNPSLDSSGVPPRIEGRRATPQASGDLGEIQRFMTDYTDRVVAQRNDYLLELHAIGWNSILDAERIKNDTTLSESKVMIERAKAIVDKYDKKTAVLLQDTRARISALAISEATKKRMLGGFDKSMDIAGSQIDQQWNLEKEAVLQFEHIVLLLAASKEWAIEGGKIRFRSDAELARFNSYIQKIQEIAQKQEEIQKNRIAEMQQILEATKNAVAR